MQFIAIGSLGLDVRTYVCIRKAVADLGILERGLHWQYVVPRQGYLLQEFMLRMVQLNDNSIPARGWRAGQPQLESIQTGAGACQHPQP